MKQTAVEWLVDQLHRGKELITIIIQAKEMEKKQIIEAYITGEYDSIAGADRTASQYYNENYKK